MGWRKPTTRRPVVEPGTTGCVAPATVTVIGLTLALVGATTTLPSFLSVASPPSGTVITTGPADVVSSTSIDPAATLAMTLPHANVTVLPGAMRTVKPPQTDMTTFAVPVPATEMVTPSAPSSVRLTVYPVGMVVNVPVSARPAARLLLTVYVEVVVEV